MARTKFASAADHDRRADPLSFAETICGHPVGYIRVETIEGKRTCILIDEDGEVIALSEYGMSPLISLAAHHGWEVLTVH